MKNCKKLISIVIVMLMTLSVLPIVSSATGVPGGKYLVSYDYGKSQSAPVFCEKYFTTFESSVYDKYGENVCRYKNADSGSTIISIWGNAAVTVDGSTSMSVFDITRGFSGKVAEYSLSEGMVIPYYGDYTTAIYGTKTDILNSFGSAVCTVEGFGVYLGEKVVALFDNTNDTAAKLIKVDGTPIGSDEFEDLGLFGNGLAPAMKNGKYGFIDKNGGTVIDYQYDNATSFSFGRAMVETNGEKEIIDTKGQLIFKVELPDGYVEQYEGGLFVVSGNEGDGEIYCLYTGSGTPIEGAEGVDFVQFDGQYVFLIQNDDGSGCLYDKNGSIILSDVCDASVDAEYGVIVARENGGRVYNTYDLTGNKTGTLPDTYWYYSALTETYLTAENVNDTVKFGLTSHDGREIIPCEYDTLYDYYVFDNGNQVYVFMDYETGFYHTYFLTHSDVPFNDIETSDWFYNAVSFAFNNDLFNGVSSTIFDANEPMTRAMLVTVLWRYAGCPAPTLESNPFIDVKSGQWYTDAVLWAAENNIVNGISENEFAPEQYVTREQIAAIIYRYTQGKGGDVSGSSSITSFHDGDRVSEYAVKAMEWAIGCGLMQGKKDGTKPVSLAPKANSTRAEVATIFMRYLNQ